MRVHRCSFLAILLMASALSVFVVPVARAANGAGTAQSAPAATKPAENPESGSENDQFRHTPKVEAIARIFHVSTETAAEFLEDLNSAILIFVILFFLFKALPKALRSRTATIQKQLIEARSATEVANERLTAVEAKLSKIGEDIDAIRQQTEREMVEDEKHIKQSLTEESARIVKSAEQEIASAGAAAQRELKRFAADLAIDKAAQRIQLTAEGDKAMIERFGKDLAGQFGNRGRN